MYKRNRWMRPSLIVPPGCQCNALDQLGGASTPDLEQNQYQKRIDQLRSGLRADQIIESDNPGSWSPSRMKKRSNESAGKAVLGV